jgi:hypothetical protein
MTGKFTTMLSLALPSALGLMLVLVLHSAPAAVQTRDTPDGLIRAVYRTYTDDTNRAGLAGIYSRRLQGLIDADALRAPDGDAGRLDWDVFVDGNNWHISGLAIALVSVSADRAVIDAHFQNFKQPRRVRFDLVYEAGGWAVDEVRSFKPPSGTVPAWTMSKVLRPQ